MPFDDSLNKWDDAKLKEVARRDLGEDQARLKVSLEIIVCHAFSQITKTDWRSLMNAVRGGGGGGPTGGRRGNNKYIFWVLCPPCHMV